MALTLTPCVCVFVGGMARHDSAVLNGIAYRTEDQTLWVTGKLWPTLFEIHLGETLRTHAGLGTDRSATTTAQPPACAPLPQLGDTYTSSPTDRYLASSTASPTPERWPWERSNTSTPLPADDDVDAAHACTRISQGGGCIQVRAWLHQCFAMNRSSRSLASLSPLEKLPLSMAVLSFCFRATPHAGGHDCGGCHQCGVGQS